MLWMIGLGIYGVGGISLQSLDILKSCDVIYVERYTSSISDAELYNLDRLIRDEEGKTNTVVVPRWFLEDGREVLKKAQVMEVALLTYGDPLIATTHTELLVRAVKNSVKVKIIHGVSGISSLIGETGLHMYKFGRTVTITSEPQSAATVYGTIYDNLNLGNHTMVLTEYKDRNEEVFFLDPKKALLSLLELERDLKSGACHEETFAVILSRIGLKDEKKISGKIKSLLAQDYGKGPHTLIVTGLFHFVEVDALKALTHSIDEPSDNTSHIHNKSATMIERYVPKARAALSKARIALENEVPSQEKGRLFEIYNNAENYIEDAIRFLRTGKSELAILSIGYAEGLIDAAGTNEQLQLGQ
ncbi:MAG: diphthine synthase [Thermoproteota archaeon]|jgi:diphthine synthase|nr:diphthine synthase [Thermoproteota archaeon]